MGDGWQHDLGREREGAERYLALKLLLPGTHILTVTALDSEGMSAAVTTIIFIGYRLYLPLTER